MVLWSRIGFALFVIVVADDRCLVIPAIQFERRNIYKKIKEKKYKVKEYEAAFFLYFFLL